MVAAVWRGLHSADKEVGAHAVGDEGLGAVDDPAVVDTAGVSADRGDVRARARLGDPERRNPLALDRRAQKALVLVGGAELVYGRGRDPGVGAKAGADPAGGAGCRKLLGPDRVVDVIAALAAKLGRVLEAEEAELGGAGVELTGELARFFPGVDIGRDLRSHPPMDRLAKLRMLVCERRHQRSCPRVFDHVRLHAAILPFATAASATVRSC